MNRLKNLAIACIVIALAVYLASGALSPRGIWAGAQPYRVSLDPEIYDLRVRLDRLESYVNRLNLSSPQLSPGRNKPATRLEPTYDRLATLVIELKERINVLEAKVNKLEMQVSPTTKSNLRCCR